ncbi:MAG: preprotein translocase subunit SecA, partial [Candidatus Spechtbacteria bacterium RIFCSPLOWO2_01_FULL_46_10]
MSIFTKFLASGNDRAIKKMWPTVKRINALEPQFEKLAVEELPQKTKEFKERLVKGESLDKILPEAYALVRETARRTLGQRHFDVQLMGGILLHSHKIAEMRTGEGKTLTETLPVYLNALEGKGAHVVTVNDYLSRRDAVWMGQIYHKLGLSVGAIAHESAFLYDPEYKLEDEKELEEVDKERDTTGSFKIQSEFLRPVERKQAYDADVTYGTNNEFGFDYLRDNLVQAQEQKVQRGYHYAIVDEVDSILIDEARTPLIISAPDAESTDLYKTFARIVPRLKESVDYNIDFKMKSVAITEEGITKIERELGISNIYDPTSGGGVRYVHQLEQALKAHALFTLDKDYVVREGEVIIVDEFTGRLMPGRRYSEGLHQAIEAKENVEVQKESRTLASITFQNYFRMYEKLAGMTGTAKTSEEEFFRVYKLEVEVIPTNRPMIRRNMNDLVFRSEHGKFTAVAEEIKRRHATGQPILVGTTSIEKNEYLHALLEREGVPHQILNAKNHEKEAQVIAQAGKLGAVTVATNMAGRGVDIILSGNPPDKTEAEKIKELGGLHVLGTERHEARRIDDQLRGRAGRQGDPGSSQFFVSLEDNLMKAFGGDRIKNLMGRLNIPENQPIDSKMVSGAIESAQKKIEGFNFDARKYLLEYDEVLNRQRRSIYKKRDEILFKKADELEDIFENYLDAHLDRISQVHMGSENIKNWNIEEVVEEFRAIAGEIDSAVHKKLQDFAADKKEEMVARREH